MTSGFEVRSFGGTHGSHGKYGDALRGAKAAAAAGERFVLIRQSRGMGALELLPYCPAPGTATGPAGNRACGRGDVGDGGWCPDHETTHHPEPGIVACPLCGAPPGTPCLTMTGSGTVWADGGKGPWPLAGAHEERHAAALKAVNGCQTVLF